MLDPTLNFSTLMYFNNNSRRKLNETSDVIGKEMSKEEQKKIKMTWLVNKYFNKIVNAIETNKNSQNKIFFFYNYYDFINNKLGKPHGLVNELMYEMSYEYSQYVSKDTENKSITFKTLYGQNFNWILRGKNMMIISW